MSVCAGIKRDGGRCTAPALPGEGYCYGHHPDYAQKRRRNAAKSHRTRSASPEIAAIKERLSALADDVLKGSVDRADGAVVAQILNVYLRATGMELKIKESEELERRLEELEELQSARGRRGRVDGVKGPAATPRAGGGRGRDRNTPARRYGAGLRPNDGRSGDVRGAYEPYAGHTSSVRGS